MKMVMLRLPEKVAEKIQTIADKKSIGLSTAIREIVCENIDRYAPVSPQDLQAQLQHPV